MIKSVTNTTNNYNYNTQHKENKKETLKYSDPLNNWVIRGMSYSSDVGAAISEIAPKLGAALWAPTFMYLGADIYDKYKTDKNGINPSGTRALERAIYQGLMSLIVMPAVIFASQKMISPLAKLSKFKLSTNAKEAVIRHTRDVINQSRGETFDDYSKFKHIVLSTLENKLEARENDKNSANFFKKIINRLTDRYPMVNANREKLLEFAEENTKKVFAIKTALLTNDKKNIPYNVLRKYNSVLPTMKEMYGHDYSKHALRSALKEYQNSLIFKNKLLKTVVGFTSMLVLTAPLTKYVQNNIMKKYINPEIDQISREFVTKSKMKAVFNEMDKRKANIN